MHSYIVENISLGSGVRTDIISSSNLIHPFILGNQNYLMPFLVGINMNNYNSSNFELILTTSILDALNYQINFTT